MKKLFIIDNDKLITTAYSDFLTDKGYVVASCNSPFGVTTGIRVLDPDIVIVDLNVPGLSGKGLLNIIDYGERYKVVLISGDSQEDEMKTLTANGKAHAYFVKGAPLNILAHKISRLLHACNTDHPQICPAR